MVERLADKALIRVDLVAQAYVSLQYYKFIYQVFNTFMLCLIILFLIYFVYRFFRSVQLDEAKIDLMIHENRRLELTSEGCCKTWFTCKHRPME